MLSSIKNQSSGSQDTHTKKQASQQTHTYIHTYIHIYILLIINILTTYI